MDEKQLYRIDELTLDLYLNLEILNNALKQMEMNGSPVSAVSSFVENIYKKSDEIRKIF